MTFQCAVPRGHYMLNCAVAQVRYNSLLGGTTSLADSAAEISLAAPLGGLMPLSMLPGAQGNSKAKPAASERQQADLSNSQTLGPSAGESAGKSPYCSPGDNSAVRRLAFTEGRYTTCDIISRGHGALGSQADPCLSSR